METDDGAWRLAFESVFLGPLRLARTVANFASHEGGSIVLVLSTSVREPIEGLALSNGLRPALAMTAKTLADELGARNVRVNGILPGRIDTERARAADAAGGRPEEVRRANEAGDPAAPLRRAARVRPSRRLHALPRRELRDRHRPRRRRRHDPLALNRLPLTLRRDPLAAVR